MIWLNESFNCLTLKVQGKKPDDLVDNTYGLASSTCYGTRQINQSLRDLAYPTLPNYWHRFYREYQKICSR